MNLKKLEFYEKQLRENNLKILSLLSERGYIEEKIKTLKETAGLIEIDSLHNEIMLNELLEKNKGPYSNAIIEKLFKEIFKASQSLEDNVRNHLLVSREKKKENTIIEIKGEKLGDGLPHFIFGPCSVESYDQIKAVAKSIKNKGMKFIRGGAFKPRTSPYDFQGLGIEGLKMLKEISNEFGLIVVSEIMSTEQLDNAMEYVDIVQIGARNMQNFELLKAAGSVQKPVLLKRGFASTIEEFIHAAEYLYLNGNEQIILCERGIRTFERATRNTLDITSVPILKQETHLPVIVDVTHSTGRKDLLLPAAKAALAIGADGIMAEVHPNPSIALSDSNQQMDLQEFDMFMSEILKFTRLTAESSVFSKK